MSVSYTPVTEWSTTTSQTMRAQVDQLQTRIFSNASTVEQIAPSVVMNLQGANSQNTTARAAIDTDLEAIRRRTNNVTSIIERITSNNKGVNTRIAELKQKADITKKAVEEAETLAKIRKEQSDALAKRGAGNLHSSWMGLWRPLSEQSYSGLIIASIAFGLIAIATFVYVFFILPSPSPESIPDVTRLFGGFRRHFKRS